MDRLIREATTKTLDMKSLQRSLPDKCKVVRYDVISRAKTFKEAMRGNDALIILWNVHDRMHRTLNVPGHFFVLTEVSGKPYVFSSTGMSPKKELFLTQSDPSFFARILPNPPRYNSHKLQGNKEANPCWRYCILFCWMVVKGNMSPKDFIGRLSRRLLCHNPDEVVTALTFDSLFQG